MRVKSFLLLMFFAAGSLLQVKSQEVPISDFDSGSLSPFYSWGAPLSIEANPDGTPEDSVALLDQSGSAWSGIASWWNDGTFFSKIDSIKVDVYLNLAGAIQFYAGNSLSGVENFTQFVDGVPEKTWTTYTFNMADLTATDFRQFAVQYSQADSIWFDNFRVYGSPTIVDIVVESEDHDTLETAVVEAGLVDDISPTGKYTLFAPTDAAFAALPAGVLDDLLADPTGELANILLYHLLEGEVMSTDLSDGMTATTMLGKDIEVTISGSDVFINDAQVTLADIQAFNGVVHVIDAVLTPPTTVVDVIIESADHTTLETAVVEAELADDLNVTGPFTVFAPTDDAFAALPAGVLDDLLADPTGDLAEILLYHVVAGEAMSTDLTDGQVIETLLGKDIEVTISGSDVFINDAQVTVADVAADNGVVHVIDAVLIPPRVTVVDIVVESEDHDTLEAAVVAADLVETLNGEGPFTVFAPTDDAFAALPAGVLDDLLADPAGDLTDILLYHVVAAMATSDSLSDGQVIETVLGKDIMVTINNDGVFVNDAQVTVADIETDNGVVHVIDAVLLPPPDVMVMEDDEYGQILTDHEGNTLYFFTRDAYDTSACTGGCLDFWPVFYAENPSLSEELNADDFGSIDKGDGVMQTTFKGWPLYYFANDENPGDTNGEAVNGIWFVAKPDYTIMMVDNQLTGNDGVDYTGDYTEGEEIIQYFTDGMGLTLYTWVNDNYLMNNFTNEDFSNNSVWPIYEEDTIVVPSVLNAAEFAIIDVFGSNQLTYKGWPLYYFGQDNMMRGSNKGVSVPSPGIWPVAVQDMMMAPYTTVVEIIVESENHQTLEDAVVAANLVETLEGEGPFTVFAPTDAAFEALPDGLLNELLADPEGELTDILLYHVVAGMNMSTDLSDGQVITTQLNEDLKVTINNEGVFINEAQVTVADIIADNGVVHVIDAVLVPPLAETVVDIIVESPVHTTLESAVIAADLVETLQGEGPFTVFAPTDAAFNALPEGVLDDLLADPTGELTDILLYHVVAGKTLSGDLSDGQMITTQLSEDLMVSITNDGVFINDAQVVLADLEAQNGVVHVIDAVLLPPLPETVVDIVVNSPDHTTLESAVIAAGLVETLQVEGPFTVFAPTDAAFDALPEGALDDLLADPTGDLTDILLYHVVAGMTMSTDLSDGQMITTQLGEDLTVSITGEGVFINDAEVTVADLEAQNGVVHVIDAVLLPSTSVKDHNSPYGIFSIYPNPAVNEVNLRINDVNRFKNGELEIIRIDGVVMSRIEINSLRTTIDLSGYESGVYYLRYSQNSEEAVRKLLIK